MSDFASILPPNSTETEIALEAAICVAGPDVTPVKTLMDPATCPAHLLPWLAWSFSVDVWDDTWPEETKRNVIAASPSVHRRKGTIGAAKTALVAAGYGEAEIIERYGSEIHDGAFSHDGSAIYNAPDHWAEYRIRLVRPITIDQATQVRAILTASAPARSRLKALDFREAQNIHDARISHDGQFTHGVA